MTVRWRAAPAVVALALAVAAAVGCGGASPERPGDRERRPNIFDPGKGRSPAVDFEGGAFEGTLYLSAGQDILNQDLYRARGSLDRVERLTKEGRISSMTANAQTLVLGNARGSGSDRVEVADLTARQALPGHVVDSAGQVPALSPSGKLLYAVPEYTDSGGDAGYKYFVTTTGPGARKRLALRTREDSVGWAPDEKIGLLRSRNGKLIVAPGTPEKRTIDSGFRRASVFGFQTSSRGDVLFSARRKDAIVERGGTRRVFDNQWSALTWSPDGSSLLVRRGRRIGRMSVRDGSVTEIGRVVGKGKLYGTQWVTEESP